MSEKQRLASTKQNAQHLYEFYLESRNMPKHTLTVTMFNYPNPLSLWSSIYPIEETYDFTSKIIKDHYKKTGIKCVISGPQGLGAIGGPEFDRIITWVIAHADWMKIVPPMFKLGKATIGWYRRYRKEKEMRHLRSLRPKIQLDIELFISDYEGLDPIQYFQQLLLDYRRLAKVLNSELDYVEYYPKFTVILLESDKTLSLSVFDDPTLQHIHTIIKKLDKLSHAPSNVSFTFRRRWFWSSVEPT